MSDIAKDIYTYLESYDKITKEEIQELSDSIANVLYEKVQQYREPSLSMSSIGKPSRRIYMDLHYPVKPNGQMRLRFLYGDIIEQLVIWLLKKSGHSVTGLQETVEFDGVKGSIDLLLDGELRDVKSCSSQSFKKFKMGYLPSNDPFGYCAQLAGYNTKYNSKRPGFIAVDKTTAEIYEYLPDPDFDLPNPKVVIEKAKKASETMSEEPCHPPVPKGVYGNMVVDKKCKSCPHLHRCWKDATVVEYSTGPEYFTTIVRDPKPKKGKQND